MRETARMLERHICLDAAPSKTKGRTELFAFFRFDQSNKQKDLDAALQSLQLTRELFQTLKDDGDEVAHKDCHPMKVDEMLKFLDQ